MCSLAQKPISTYARGLIRLKVLLVEHPKKLWPLFGNGVAQPIHLAYLTAILEENEIDVDILDCTALDYGWEQYEKFLEKVSLDIVGVSGITPFLSAAISTRIAR